MMCLAYTNKRIALRSGLVPSTIKNTLLGPISAMAYLKPYA